MTGRIHFCIIALFLLWVPNRHVSAEEPKLTFGQRQLEQLLDDRPEMRPVLKRDDAIFLWAAIQFEGGGERVYWDNREPVTGRPSEYIPPMGYYPRLIRIAEKGGNTGAEKWANLVFELSNCKNYPKVAVLVRAAINGEISREEFAKACVKLEFEAMVHSRDLLKKNPIRGFAEPEFPEAFSDYVKLLDLGAFQDKYDPRDYYSSYYDHYVRPQLK